MIASVSALTGHFVSFDFYPPNNQLFSLMEKYMFVSHIKHTQWKIDRSTSFEIDNMYYVNFKI